MNKTVRNKVHLAFGWFLLIIFFGSLLMKPTHILLVHHDRPDVVTRNFRHDTLSNYAHQECAICDFEFYYFISQDQAQLPHVKIFLTKKLTERTFTCLVCQSSHHFQLRAPPVL